MYTFMIDISSNYIDSFIIKKHISLSWIMLFALKPILCNINIRRPSFLFASCVFLCLHKHFL